MYRDIIEDFLNDNFFMANRRTMPGLDTDVVRESDGSLTITMAVPGCSEEDVTVELGRGLLSVEAEVRGTHMSRTYSLPQRVDPEAAVADVTNGLLTIKIPSGSTGTRRILGKPPDKALPPKK